SAVWVIGAGKSIVGAVTSATTMCCVCVDSLPLPSLKCQVTSEVPCVVRVSESLVVPVIVPLQLSVAVGAEAIVAEHSPVASAREAAFGTGAVWSATTMCCVCVDSLPLPSLKCQVTT